ncbi:hypothetical protein [Tabrizicola oligotrophica]|uniref:Calcium-binding protein n=1 Tax=Tabrizicola oligotrophica TaxID=2710650 RepID=A0A6M0QYU5_9RHOB|nr:hypothetical protein [Tabrizicola oligotrophica]NEY92053.1 hypothetical protein [Tabrizicola oligotrophica]
MSHNSNNNRDRQGSGDHTATEGRRPILLDLDGDGIEITELTKSTVFTDTSGDGLDHRTAWAGAGDGVLFIDADGNGQLSNSHEFVFTEWADGAKDDLDGLRRAFDSNGDGKLTSADARWGEFRVQVTKADGSQEVKTLGELGITELDLTADATEILLPDGSTITGQSSFVMNGVTRVLANTRLMAEAQGYRVEEVVSTAANGKRTVTQSGYDQTGDRVFVVTSVTSANGLSITNRFDQDGDGVVDRLQSLQTVLNADGSRTETVINRQGSDATTAVVLDRVVTTTSADGKQVSIQRDTTGGGWFDQTEVRTTAANGSRTVVISDLANEGSVIRSSTETQTADGLTRVRSDNLDGTGGEDRITTEILSEDAEGVRTEITAVTNRDGSDRVSETLVISADGRTRTTSVDLNGDGADDQKIISVTTLGVAGNTSTVETIRNANNSLVTQTNSTVSADGLVRTTSQKLDGDADFDRYTNDTTVIDAAGNHGAGLAVDRRAKILARGQARQLAAEAALLLRCRSAR